MKVLTSFKNGLLVLYFEGELDHHESRDVAQRLERILEEYLPRDCAMDLSGLRFMDSSGIAVILRVYRRMKEMGGRAWVENPGTQPLRVLDASGIDRVVKISLSEGVRS